jgi:hypothetical protein
MSVAIRAVRGALVLVTLGLAVLPAASVRAADLDDIVARYVEARGGLARIRALKSLRMTGTIAFGPSEPAPFLLEMKRPNRMRTSFRFGGQTGIQAFDGTRAWGVLPMAGKTEAEFLPDEASREAAEQSDIEGPLVDAAAKGTKLAYLGLEKVLGRDCHKLAATLRSGTLRYFYLDAATGLEAKSEGKRRAGSDEVVIETLSQDYREVAGLKFPFFLEAGPARRPERQRIVFEKIEVDVLIDDQRFERTRPRP